jgi:hypothetical protein
MRFKSKKEISFCLEDEWIGLDREKSKFFKIVRFRERMQMLTLRTFRLHGSGESSIFIVQNDNSP